MTILPISAVDGAAGFDLSSVAPPAAAGTGGSAFADAINNVQQLQSTSNELSIQAVTGDLDDIHQAMVASTRASVTFELVAAVRNKGVEAFNEIMRMQA